MMMLFIKSYLCKTEEVMDNKSNCQGPPLFSGLGSGSIEVSKYVREKTRTCAARRVRARVRVCVCSPPLRWLCCEHAAFARHFGTRVCLDVCTKGERRPTGSRGKA